MPRPRIKPSTKTIRDKKGKSLGTVRVSSTGKVTIKTKRPKLK